MCAEPHFQHHTIEAVEPHTIAIIIKFYGGVVVRCLRSIYTIYIYVEGYVAAPYVTLGGAADVTLPATSAATSPPKCF
jgi:hypothetical protein